MGFSWAFYLAQEALKEVVRRSLPSPRFVTDFLAAPDLELEGPVAMIYADNGNHLGVDRASVNAERLLVETELNRVGLATHEVVEATPYVKVLGGMVDGIAHRVSGTPERVARLQKALGVLVAGRAVSGKDLEHVIGHVLTLLLLNRLTLSFSSHVYDFVKDSYLQKRSLLPSVRIGLALIRDLLPL